MTEVWRAVIGYEGFFEVSDHGRMRSLDRLWHRLPSRRHPSGHATKFFGKILRPGKSSNGYLTVVLGRPGAKRESVLVQWIVADAFIGPRPEGMLVLHENGHRDQNAVGNLYYGTRLDNAADCDRHGNRLRGSAYATAKLTEKLAGAVKALRGIQSQSYLARRARVSRSAVQAAQVGRTWTHAPTLSRAEAETILGMRP